MMFKSLGPEDQDVLLHVAPGVFDKPIDRHLTDEFLNDSRHHLVVAVDDGLVVGMISAVHYVNPDKPRELWINEVGVADSHRRRGVARGMMAEMLATARRLGCTEAWVLTDRSNTPAMRLYASIDGVMPPDDSVMFTFDLA